MMNVWNSNRRSAAFEAITLPTAPEPVDKMLPNNCQFGKQISKNKFALNVVHV